MGIHIDKTVAEEVLFEEADRALAESVPEWEPEVERLSDLCEDLGKTHIAFLGTAFLAKAVDLKADVFSIKYGADSEGAYSARSLGHGVLVPHAPELGIDLGVTGREPLNNQPYFRHDFVSPSMTVHGSTRPALEVLCEVLEKLQDVSSAEEARAALRGFIRVRRSYFTVARVYDVGEMALLPYDFIQVIDEFVNEDSEGGKRAQAVAAGLVGLYAGPDRVVTGRVNDPDRHLPGDVGVSGSGEDEWERVFEVRDKPVSKSDLIHFVRKAADAAVGRAGMVAVASTQEDLPAEEVVEWAAESGVLLEVFIGWASFVPQVTFWAAGTDEYPVATAHRLIYDRLVEIEVSETAQNQWLELTG